MITYPSSKFNPVTSYIQKSGSFSYIVQDHYRIFLVYGGLIMCWESTVTDLLYRKKLPNIKAGFHFLALFWRLLVSGGYNVQVPSQKLLKWTSRKRS